MLSSYSHSALGTYRSCPRQFKFRYVEKVKVPRKVNVDAYLGNVVHRALRRLYTLGADGILCPLDDIIDYYRKEWEKVDRGALTVVSDYYGVDDYIRIGQEMLITHYRKYQPFDRGTLLGAEIRLPFVLPGTAFRFTTIIDRLTKRPDGTVELCDYKTGRQMLRPQDPAFFFQMGLYQLAVAAAYPQLERIELVQYYLRQDEEVRHEMTPEELDSLVEAMRLAILETIQAERMDDFPPVESGLCNWCDYFDLCPAKRHKRLLGELERNGGGELTVEEKAAERAERYLELDQKEKELKAEKDAVKGELIDLARELDATKLTAPSGEINIRLKREQKFVTKTDDAGAFADLSFAVRQMGADDYFVLDAGSFMKEVYLRGRLTEDQKKRLERFVVEKESARVTTKLYRQDEDDES
ncbi:MAG: PD-(D/E)XK nuclease family protein [candidate division Zixibacteria bacterium]|nr:PD-(D/E)XK nuclease family protein [candidate division Zixibacteria bacterium]